MWSATASTREEKKPSLAPAKYILRSLLEGGNVSKSTVVKHTGVWPPGWRRSAPWRLFGENN